MKMVSLVALTAAMLSVATPADAQKSKKDKEQATPQLQMSDAFRKPAAAADAAIKAKDWATADTQLALAEGQARNEDEKYAAAAMRLTVEANRSTSAAPNTNLARALNAMIANPKTPPGNLSLYYYFLGKGAFEAKAYADSVPLLIKARDLGSKEEQIPLYLAQAYDATNRRAEGVAEMVKAIDAAKSAGRKPEDSWYNWAISRLYNLNQRSAAAQLSRRQMADFPTATNWRKVVVIYRGDLAGSGVRLDRAQRIDLFRLMRATGALADESDYFDYAKDTFEGGLAWETVAVIGEGRKAKKIPDSKPEFADLETRATAQVKSEGSLETLARDAAKGADGRLAAGTGDAFLATGDNARALELYDLALSKGGISADTVNLHRGVALVRLGRKEEARTAFGLVKAAPLSDIAGFWTSSLDFTLPLAG